MRQCSDCLTPTDLIKTSKKGYTPLPSRKWDDSRYCSFNLPGRGRWPVRISYMGQRHEIVCLTYREREPPSEHLVHEYAETPPVSREVVTPPIKNAEILYIYISGSTWLQIRHWNPCFKVPMICTSMLTPLNPRIEKKTNIRYQHQVPVWVKLFSENGCSRCYRCLFLFLNRGIF